MKLSSVFVILKLLYYTLYTIKQCNKTQNNTQYKQYEQKGFYYKL